MWLSELRTPKDEQQFEERGGRKGKGWEETYVVDETVLGSIVLRFQRPEQRLLRTEELDRARRVLGQVEQASGVRNEPRSDELSDEGGKIGGDGGHSVSEILVELGTVLGDGDDLVTEGVDVGHVGVGDFGSHGELGGSLEGGFEVFGKNVLERGGGGVGSEAYIVERDERIGAKRDDQLRRTADSKGQQDGRKERKPTHGSDDLGVGHVVNDDLAHLGEVPSVPFLSNP
jgi:hypothetical protein